MRENEKLNNTEQQLEEIKVLKESLYKQKEKMDNFWKTFLRTGVIILAAIVVLVFLGIAWFVMNNWVKGESTAISALGENRFSLATLEDSSTEQGVYDVNENNKGALARALSRFFRVDRNGRDDDKGNYYKYFENLPILDKGTSTFKDTDGKTYILGDSDGISLQVNTESNVNNTEEFEHLGPGSRGKITFYIIPYVNNLGKVNLSVSLKAFTLERVGDVSESNESTGKAVQILPSDENIVLMNMLRGHILLFTGMDESGNYSNRVIPEIDDEGRISFQFEINGENCEKNQPLPITVYWIWPRRFENIKFCGQEDSVFKSECQSYVDLLDWVNTNKAFIVNTKEVTDLSSLVSPTADMTNAQLSQWSTGYNKGDQLIGENVAYFQWMIEAQ